MEKMRARKIAAGLRQVNVWGPADQVEVVRRFAAELVADHSAQARQGTEDDEGGKTQK
jgi:hypothetical protein